MTIDSRRYVDAVSGGMPQTTNPADIEAATQAGAAAGAISGAEAGAEAGVASGAKAGADAGAESGAQAGATAAVEAITPALTQAEQAAADAAASAAAADAQRALAVLARTGAETARDQAAAYAAAIDTATFYPDEATGRAAVADGAFFKVISTVSDGVLIYRRTNSTTSVLQQTMPSVVKVGSMVNAIPCSVGGSGNAYTMTPAAGFFVRGSGVDQEFAGNMLATNSAAGLTVAIAGVFGGVATQVVLPTGEAVPALALKGPVSGQSFPFKVKPVGNRYVLLHPTYIPAPAVTDLTVVSTLNNTAVMRLTQPGVRTTPTMYDLDLSFIATEDKPFGTPSYEIRANDGTTVILNQTAILDRLGANTLQPAGLWKKGERVTFRRVQAAPWSSNFMLVSTPNTALVSASQLTFTMETVAPTTAGPVVMVKATETSWLAHMRAFAYDPAFADQLDKSNQQIVEIYNAGTFMSQAVLKSAYAHVWRSMRFIKNGKLLDYANFFSRETSPGVFIGEQPSTPNWVLRLGLAGQPTSTYGICGLWHGLLEMITASVKVAGDATEYVASPVNTLLRGTAITFDSWYNAYYAQPTNDADKVNKWAGVIRDRFVLDANGVTAYPEFYTGQRLGYNTGSVLVEANQTVNGATSGATASVVFVPFTGQTGSIGAGTLAGTLFLDNIVLGPGDATFQVGEVLRVGTTPVAVVTSAPSAEIGSDNSLGALTVSTNVNRAKLKGQPEIVVGFENGDALPLPNGTWPLADAADTMGLRHTNEPDAWFETILLDGAPMTPPGNFSECLANSISVEDRIGGNIKPIFNFRSQPSSAVPGRKWQGKHTTRTRWRMRIGAPV